MISNIQTSLTLLTAVMMISGISCKSEDNKPISATVPVVKEVPTEALLCGTGLNISPKTPVITINNKAILCSELMEQSHIAMLHAEAEYREKIRDLQQQTLTTMVDERLLEQEMDGSGQKLEEFIGTHVRAEPVSTDEMQEFYKQAVAAGEKLPPYDEVKSELAVFINEQKQKQALALYRASLRDKADIDLNMPILLPPVFDVNVEGESKGPETAPITIVEFSDFECGYCALAEPTIEKILTTYGDKVRFVYRDLPLPIHSFAVKAAEAAYCSKEQGKYWEMHAMLFANQRALDLPSLKRYAGELQLDQKSFDSCLDEGKTNNSVTRASAEADRLGIGGTPAFFVNGRFLSGAQPFERFAELIDYELASK